MGAGIQPLSLAMITNRGIKVWPDGLQETFCVDHWRYRLVPAGGDGTLDHGQISAVLGNFARAGIDFIKTEHLYDFDGQPGYSQGHGQ